MFLAQNHPICQGKAKPSGSLVAVAAPAAPPPPGCVEGAAAWWCRRGSSLSRVCSLLWVGWRAWVGGAWPSCGGEALVCGAGRRSPRTGGPQEGVLVAARVAAAQLSPSVLVANARRLGVVRLHVKHGVCLMRFLDCADGQRRRMQ